MNDFINIVILILTILQGIVKLFILILSPEKNAKKKGKKKKGKKHK